MPYTDRGFSPQQFHSSMTVSNMSVEISTKHTCCSLCGLRAILEAVASKKQPRITADIYLVRPSPKVKKAECKSSAGATDGAVATHEYATAPVAF